jgi:hypothetical protein
MNRDEQFYLAFTYLADFEPVTAVLISSQFQNSVNPCFLPIAGQNKLWPETSPERPTDGSSVISNSSSGVAVFIQASSAMMETVSQK